MLILAFAAFALAAEIEVLAEGFFDPRFITEHNGRLYVTTAGSDVKGSSLFDRTGGVFELRRDDDGHDDDDDHHHHVHVRKLATFDSVFDEGSGTGPAGIAVHDNRVFVVNQLSNTGNFANGNTEFTPPTFDGRDFDFGLLYAFDLDDDDKDDDDDRRRKYVIGNPGDSGFAQTEIGVQLNVAGAPHQPEGADSDPYGIYYDEEDDTIYVANAGSNYLQAVKDGKTRIVAFFPSTGGDESGPFFNASTGLYNANAFKEDGEPSDAYLAGGDATPTAVTKGPDGYLYVTTLNFGQSFGTPSSHLYRIDRHAENYVVQASDSVASGFGFATDVAFSRHHGAFFIVEYATAGASGGALVRVKVHHREEHRDDDDDDHHRDHHDDHRREEIIFDAPEKFFEGQLNNPNGVAVDDDGRIFLTDVSVQQDGGAPNAGRVLRVRL